jgi:hypothetical protein
MDNLNTIAVDDEIPALLGTLLYYDGVTLLLVDKNDNQDLIFSNKTIPAEWLPKVKDLGLIKIKGEIIDPKCYFGVMKPGEGKPHRDCAIRCILGGITPMLAVKNEQGDANYYLLASSVAEVSIQPCRIMWPNRLNWKLD